MRIERYTRIIQLYGPVGFENIRKSSVAIFGVGGLGNFVLTELALSGVKKIYIVDKDYVKIENLNRQFLYGIRDLGKEKVFIAKERIKELNPDVEVIPIFGNIKYSDLSFIENVDILVDCLDNWEARKYLYEIAKKHDKPVVHGSVSGFKGYVGFLWKKIDKFMKEKEELIIPIDASTVGVIGSLQANICLKYLAGYQISEFIMYVDLEKFKFELYYL